MISVYQGDQGRPEGPDYPDIPEHPELPGHPGLLELPGHPELPDHPEYPEHPGNIHRYWMAGLEILDDGLKNTAWQANR